jgi:uncharacterized protein (DUF983 family)
MQNSRLNLGLVFRGVCPSCKTGKVTNGLFGIRKRCAVCDYNFFPEPGFYLGAMMVSFMVSAFILVPTIILLKFSDVQPETMIIWPIAQFILVAPILIHYSRVLWLHVEYSITDRLDGHDASKNTKSQ